MQQATNDFKNNNNPTKKSAVNATKKKSEQLKNAHSWERKN